MYVCTYVCMYIRVNRKMPIFGMILIKSTMTPPLKLKRLFTDFALANRKKQ